MSKEKEGSKVKEAEAKPAEEVVEEKAAKPKKVRAEKKKKIGKKIFTYYKVDAAGLTRLHPYCERCGPGFFMADHGNRYTCGHCGFTRYKQNQE